MNQEITALLNKIASREEIDELERWRAVPEIVKEEVNRLKHAGDVKIGNLPIILGPESEITPASLADSIVSAVLSFDHQKIAGSSEDRRAAKLLTRLPVEKLKLKKIGSFLGGRSGMDAGAAFLPSIPVDSFNRAVWNDVTVGSSSFGSKDRFGTNNQPMKTPAPVAAAVSGIVSGASAAKGNVKHVSAWDIARTAAISGAKGWLGGLVLGKTLGALAGISPESQKKLQQIGVWGGILTGAAQKAFSR